MPHRVTLRLPSLSGSDGIPYRSVAEWLESIRMKRYILHFRSAGLDTMECAVLPEVLTQGLRTFLCSIFTGFSLLCLLATAILDSFSVF